VWSQCGVHGGGGRTGRWLEATGDSEVPAAEEADSALVFRAALSGVRQLEALPYSGRKEV
jgi:hypothetical protein